MIIDLTAGNRHIWGGWMPEIPELGPIIYCDIEPGLRIPPDIICDLRRLPFRSQITHAIVVDPPYWNFGTSRLHGDPQEAHGSWWGNFKNLRTLLRLLVGIVKAGRWILRPEGRLYLKWCDVVYPWKRFQSMFSWSYDEEARLERESKSGRGKKPCYWITYRLKENSIL